MNLRTSKTPAAQKTEWQTPPELFEHYNSIYNFALDAAATKANALCKSFFTLEEDALKKDWFPFKNIWLNPPYSKGVIGEFIKKAWEESRKGCTVVCLIPASTDTIYFQDYCFPYGEIRFLRGRVHFHRGDGSEPKSANFGSCIVTFGLSFWHRKSGSRRVFYDKQ